MRLLGAIFLSAVLPLSGFAQDRVFVSSDRPILETADDLTASVTFVDVDGDMDLDVVAGNDRAENRVYPNDGTGTGWSERWLGDDSNHSYGLDVADLNGDGYPEIGFANSGAFNRLFFNVAGSNERDE